MIITLLTDFGLQDTYVGIMKGIIKAINPEVNIIDLSHNIPRQDLFSASFALQNAIDYFPPNTIHVAIVDPTVGGDRKAIVMVCEQGYFICPDNGIITGVLNRYQPEKVYALNNKNYWLYQNTSTTFHGRDIFAPVAAHLATGFSLDDLGEEIDINSLVKLNLPSLDVNDDLITGAVQYIDIYGNLITNIPATILENKLWFVIENDQHINQCLTYSKVKKLELVALIGSHGYLEIAVNGGNAKMALNKNYGDLIKVKLK